MTFSGALRALETAAAHDLLEFVEGDLAIAVLIAEGEHLLDGGVVHLRVDGPDGGLQLRHVDVAAAVRVDRLERRAQLLVRVLALLELAAALGKIAPGVEHLAPLDPRRIKAESHEGTLEVISIAHEQWRRLVRRAQRAHPLVHQPGRHAVGRAQPSKGPDEDDELPRREFGEDALRRGTRRKRRQQLVVRAALPEHAERERRVRDFDGLGLGEHVGGGEVRRQRREQLLGLVLELGEAPGEVGAVLGVHLTQ